MRIGTEPRLPDRHLRIVERLAPGDREFKRVVRLSQRVRDPGEHARDGGADGEGCLYHGTVGEAHTYHGLAVHAPAPRGLSLARLARAE
eukprot:6177142-Pleurochrysis_carterae.AAC.1